MKTLWMVVFTSLFFSFPIFAEDTQLNLLTPVVSGSCSNPDNFLP